MSHGLISSIAYFIQPVTKKMTAAEKRTTITAKK